MNGLGAPDDPNETNDLDELGGLQEKDGPNRLDNQDGSVGPMTQMSLANLTIQMCQVSPTTRLTRSPDKPD